MRRFYFLLALPVLATPLWAQNESKLGADFRKERASFSGSCSSFKSILSCAQVLFTDHPLHIAVGSIAPQNGFGAGLAFVAHYTPNENWRLSWNADAVGSNNGSWRAGVYMKGIYVPTRKIVTQTGRHPANTQPVGLENPVFHLYAQTISLNKIDYFGLGPATLPSGRSFYGMRETIPGINVWWPIFRSFGEVSIFGELNGRLVSIRGSQGQPSPSIEQLYTEATAPGLTSQPGFIQHGEGIRYKSTFLNLLHLNYFVTFQQFIAPGDSQFSFRRFTTDLSHQMSIYSKTRTSKMRTQLHDSYNGPDDCSKSLDEHTCPSITRDREGSFGVRLFISESTAPSGHVVPFYFQPTLGGSDINANSSLSSFQDYRFRAPNVLLLRGSFEHSIWGALGFAFMVDEGKVALTRGDIGFSHLSHSFSTGLTLRAGGFPQMSIMFSWGGKEGTHTIANVNTSLLGGSARPSLY